MGECVTKLPHSCGTRKGLQVFEKEDGTVDGFCFSCNTYVKNPYGEEKYIKDIPKTERLTKTKEEIEEDIKEINELKAMSLVDRKLHEKYLDLYGIKVGLSTSNGKDPSVIYFPYYKEGVFKSYKAKLISPKKFWSIGDQKDVDLFGWEQAIEKASKRLVVTEGELDVVALEAIYDRHTPEAYRSSIPGFVSLPHGASAAKKDLASLADKIRKNFKEIILCFDTDDPGKKATEEACKIFPEAKVVTLPRKDANQCILDGVAKAAYKAIQFNATKNKNTRLVLGSSIHEKAKKKAEWGLSWPWKGMTDITRGIRFGETIYIGAGEKLGKSEVVNALAAHLMVEHNLKVFLAKPEESNEKTYKLLCGKVVGEIFHDPKIDFNEEAYDKAGEIIKDKVYMLDLYQHVDWDTLKSDITLVVTEGVKAVFIDPITNLTNGKSNTETDTHLKTISQELAAMAKDLDIVIFIFCHLNKPPKGSTPWDRGGKITTDFFAGSSAMARSCNYAIGLEGNKDPDLDEYTRNTRNLVILADREFGETANIELFWSKETSLFREI